jgi:hypothetical protein
MGAVSRHSRQLDAQCRASSAPLRDLLDGHKYILYLYLYASVHHATTTDVDHTITARVIRIRLYAWGRDRL